ncbi:MAG: hypothetical protein M1833_000591 [Piccolia ochrophora]|nr:MAG: hypothetical protein M1833_000591 [Piccolia ochrophora]
MAFVWGPIKLMLQLASKNLSIFDKLLDAYARIAEALPRCERLRAAFSDDVQFQDLLGQSYADVLEFHRRAYKIFRRRGWSLLFDSLWRSFDSQFEKILLNLSRSRDLVESEALSRHIVEAKDARRAATERLEEIEKSRRTVQLREVLTWLGEDETAQENEFYRLCKIRYAATCDWASSETKVSSWFDERQGPQTLWVTGNPGSGKSVLCAYIIEQMEARHDSTVAYYICNYHNPKGTCVRALRITMAQILRANQDLLPFVCETYIAKGKNPSEREMGKLLPSLLSSIHSCRIVIDGLDELHQEDGKDLLGSLVRCFSTSVPNSKLLVVSRDVEHIRKTLAKEEQVQLHHHTSLALRMYIKSRVDTLKEDFGGADSQCWNNIQQQLNAKAKGR